MLSRRQFCVLLPGATGFLSSSGHSAALGISGRPSPHNAVENWAFANPPDSARPYVLWMWMGSNVSHEGITRDLEGMKEAGIGGATIFSLADTTVPWAGFIGKSPTPDVVTFTEPWWALIRHAAAEAHRLGLELILHNCAGYESSGGTWITPELSLQEVVWSATHITGGDRVERDLPRATVDPHPHAQFPKVYMPELGRIGIPEVKGRKEYYVDIAVITVPATGEVKHDAVQIISAAMNAEGKLTWNAPAGEWTVYRFGHTTTGAMIQPAQWGAMGLECDKMNPAAVRFHVEHVLGEMKKHLGPLMGKGITTLYFDSYEAGVPNWTPLMREEFQARRGYDITPWLPVLAGHPVGSPAETQRFKDDLKRTTYDLFRDHYWATPGPLAHAAGLKFVAEPYEGPWVIDEVVKFLDVPAVEFWTHGGKYSPSDLDPVVAAARKLGSPLIVSEAFTSDPREAQWNEYPGWLKPIGDAAFCAGVNRFNMHHFVQQPWDPKYKPGNTMGQWGVHFGRNQTWWKPGHAWLTYLWRCQNLLQRGHYVAPSAETSPTFVAAGTSGKGSPEIKYLQRQLDGSPVTFVSSQAKTEVEVEARFPVTGRQPELWDPVWGTMRDLPSFRQEASAMAFDLTFAPGQSFFIVFRKPVKSAPAAGPNFPPSRVVQTLAGSWLVAFDPAWGGPAEKEFAGLTDWTLHPDEGIRFYSGTAVYRKTLHMEKAQLSKDMFLDLGICHHLAEVTVNGRKLGVVWTAPWSIRLDGALVAGENTIEIAVTNVWANRLIGDEQQPPDCLWEVGDATVTPGRFLKEFPDWFLNGTPRPSANRYTFTTWNYFTKDSALTPSGLLGPVRILASSHT